MRRALLIPLAFALLACGERAPRPSNATPVIVITIDTLRSDHLPAYGYHGIETPALDRLRADSILFERAYSHVPLTLPSHATMFTGRLPAGNGLRDNIGFQLNPDVPTLAELLRRNGYATGAAVSAFVLRRESGISRGFDFYEDTIDPANSGANVGRVQRKGDETEAIAAKWIGEHATKPFFFFLHLYEPHSPYDPPEPFRTKYGATYDGEIASADAIVGTFVAFLQRQGLYDKALIVLLSDHGEGLNEHGELEHGIFLYREALQVPLFVKLPAQQRRGASVAEPVQLSDVFATITSQTATKAPAGDGRSLVDTARKQTGPRAIYAESLFPRFHYGWSELHSLIDGTRHYIQAPKPELYDLAADAGERKNIVASDRRSYAAMRAGIAPLIRGSAAPSAISAEDAQKLAALGYIGSTVAAGETSLPDPKDKVATSGDLRHAFTLFSQEKFAEALPVMEKLSRENPRMLDVRDMLARTLDELGRQDEAIAAAKEGLRLSPNTTHLALMIARMQLDQKRLDEAQRHAELAVKTEPGAAHDLLAQIASARGDYVLAGREARLALEGRDRVEPLLTLARIEMDRKNYAGAVAYCDRGLAILASRKGTAVKGLWFLEGDALARMDRYPEAEAAFRKEIDLFPRDPRAYKNLILLLVTEGRTDEATKTIYALAEKSPAPPSYLAIATTLKTVGDGNGARYWIAQGLAKWPDDPSLRRGVH